MPTLYLNAPRQQVDGDGKKSYAETVRDGIGNGYAIPKGDAAQCLPGCDVVVLGKHEGRQAKGRLKELQPTGGKNGSGILRYNVHIEDMVESEYAGAPANLKRTGILLIV